RPTMRGPRSLMTFGLYSAGVANCSDNGSGPRWLCFGDPSKVFATQTIALRTAPKRARSRLEEVPKRARSRLEEVPKQSRSGVEGQSKSCRSALEAGSNRFEDSSNS